MENVTRLYLSNWSYNAALILDELENLVISKGGKIVSTWNKQGRKRFLISNRTLTGAIAKQEQLVAVLRDRNRPALQEQEKELERLKSIPNSPVLSRNGDFLYINFALNNIYYSFNMDSNPFFDFTFDKIPIVNGKINPMFYAHTDNKEWFKDEFYSFNCSQEIRKRAAADILKMLLNTPVGRRFNGNRREEKLYELE